MLASELKSRINKLWDRFWSGGIANPLTAIEQISYLIFMKRLEVLDDIHKKRALARKEKYKSIFESHEDCRWSHWRNFNAEDMIRHVRDKVFPFIKNLKIEDDGAFTRHMKDATFMIPKPSLLQEAVSIIDELNITSQNQDTQGDIYEYLLSELKTSGKNGQFRTPRHIIRMMVKLVDPKIGERICDPSCGTGGFLINSYEHILETHTSKNIIEYDEAGEPSNLIGDKLDKKYHKLLKHETLYGFDFDTTMVRIAIMNMILHGMERPNIDYADALSKGFSQKTKYDVVLANPPFTGSIDATDINDDFKTKTTKTELLFVELIHNILDTGRRAAVIVPNGVLFGSSNAHTAVRKMLLDKCQLEGVVTMPSGVFKPYSGVGTAVLVFTKGNKTDSVWFYEMENDGYSLDDKRDFIDGKGDIPDIIEKFKEKKKSKRSFIIKADEIRKSDYSFSPSRYKEIEHEDIEYEDPKVLIGKVQKLEKEIAEELDELKKMIK